jgi:hypothetical protein
MRSRFLRTVLGVRAVGTKILHRVFGLQKLRRDVFGRLETRLSPSVRRDQACLEFLLEVWRRPARYRSKVDDASEIKFDALTSWNSPFGRGRAVTPAASVLSKSFTRKK